MSDVAILGAVLAALGLGMIAGHGIGYARAVRATTSRVRRVGRQ
jgi:hypothetical protein